MVLIKVYGRIIKEEACEANIIRLSHSILSYEKKVQCQQCKERLITPPPPLHLTEHKLVPWSSITCNMIRRNR